MRRAVIAASLLAALMALPARAEPPAAISPADETNRTRLAYTVYFGGVRVVQLGIDAEMAPAAYDVTAHMQTIGVAKWAVPWISTARSKGKIAGLRLEPIQHRQSGELRGEPRIVAIDFKDGNVASLQVVPPPQKDYGGRQE